MRLDSCRQKLGGAHGLPTVLALGVVESSVFRRLVSSSRILPRGTPVSRGPLPDGVAERPILFGCWAAN